MRVIEPATLLAALTEFDSIVQASMARLVDCPLTPESWEQIGLPLRMGGRGLSHSIKIAPGAFIASALTFANCVDAMGLPTKALLASPALSQTARESFLTDEAGNELRRLIEAHPPISEPNSKCLRQAFWTEITFKTIHRSTWSRCLAASSNQLGVMRNLMAGLSLALLRERLVVELTLP